MNHYSALAVSAALFFSLTLMACPTKPPCDAVTCTGCCDATGTCQAGTAASMCGNGGAVCSACSDACTAGLCTTNGGGTANDSGVDDAGMEMVDAGVPDAGQLRCSATAVICRDESIQKLRLFTTVNNGLITEEGDGGSTFATKIDAIGGGMTPSKSYNYAKFTSAGLQKVAIDDESAFTSLDWDIAFRRYVIRTNGGVGGPSCTEAARIPPGTTFDALMQVPANLTWRTEEYMTPGTCDLVPDTSGIGAPGTALSSFWSYTACVKMTGNVFVVHLRDGRYVKFQVTSYYDPVSQATCNSTDTVPATNGAGNVRVKWAFIQGP